MPQPPLLIGPAALAKPSAQRSAIRLCQCLCVALSDECALRETVDQRQPCMLPTRRRPFPVRQHEKASSLAQVGGLVKVPHPLATCRPLLYTWRASTSTGPGTAGAIPLVAPRGSAPGTINGREGGRTAASHRHTKRSPRHAEHDAKPTHRPSTGRASGTLRLITLTNAAAKRAGTQRQRRPAPGLSAPARLQGSNRKSCRNCSARWSGRRCPPCRRN